LENEDRLTPQILLAGIQKRPFTIRSPESVFDSISGEALGESYVDAAKQLLNPGSVGRVHRPSGRRVSALTWAEWVNEAIAAPLGIPIDIEVPVEADRSPATRFENPAEGQLPIDWNEVARRYVSDWRELYPFL
jgi:hypothetical protein